MEDPSALRGPTKYFFEDENVDRLFSMTMTLGAEISAVSEKLDTVINLLLQQNVLTSEALTGFQPDDDQQAARDAARQEFVKTLLMPFQIQADALVDQAAKLKG
jgi:hypothetical protein